MKVILSYPRSGNHLVRFFIELLSEKPTFGCKNNNEDIEIYRNEFDKKIPFNITEYKEDECFHKFHETSQLNKHTHISEMIFIIRNPKEVLLRHNNFKINNKSYNNYWNCIDYYANYNGKKIMFFYEEIITKKEKFINKLYNFLEVVNEEKKKYVLDNLQELYDISLNGKNRSWGGNRSNYSLNHYYPQIPHEIKDEFDNYLAEKIQKYEFIEKKYFRVEKNQEQKQEQ